MAASKYRKSTTDIHPLFDGNAALYYSDARWRYDIPRAGAEESVWVRGESPDQHFGYYQFGSG